MTLTFERDLNSVEMNQHVSQNAVYVDERSLSYKVIVYAHTHTHTHLLYLDNYYSGR